MPVGPHNGHCVVALLLHPDWVHILGHALLPEDHGAAQLVNAAGAFAGHSQGVGVHQLLSVFLLDDDGLVIGVVIHVGVDLGLLQLFADLGAYVVVYLPNVVLLGQDESQGRARIRVLGDLAH